MRLQSSAMLFLVATCIVTVAQASAEPSALEKTLQARLDYAYGPVWADGKASRFVDEFLTDDAVLTASDAPQVWHGRTQSLEAIEELMKVYSLIKPKAVYTKSVGPSAAFQFVVFELTGLNANHKVTTSTAKSLYVWVKTAHGWRVTADHYSFVGMDIPK